MFTPMTGALRRAPQLREALRGRLGAAVVESHPVDDRAIGDEPEQARPRIAVLRDRGDVPTSTCPKPSACSPRAARTSLSNPAAMPNGDSKRSPSASVRSSGAGRVRPRDGPGERRDAQQPDHDHRGVVGRLGIHAREDGPEEEGIHRLQAIGSSDGRQDSAASPAIGVDARVVGAELPDRGLEVLERVESLVDAREPQVGDLVELAERAEDREPDLVRVDLR